MLDWRAWILPGFVAIVILTAISVLFLAEDVENDLSAAAREEFGNSHEWLEFRFNGRDMELSGISPSDQATREILEIAESLRGVRTVMDKTILPEIADPFQLKFKSATDEILLTGHIPSEDIRMFLIGKIRKFMPESRIEDNLVLARGAPEEFPELVSFLAGLLPGLSSSELDLIGTKLHLVGVARNPDEYEKLIAAIEKESPESSELVSVQIEPPTISPYHWSIEYDGKAARIKGFTPNFDARNAIANRVSGLLPDAKVVNEMRIALGAPAELKSATDFALGLIPLISNGKMAFENESFSIEGSSISPESFEEILYQLDRFPAGYLIKENKVRPRRISPYIWQASVNEETLTLDGYVPDLEAKRQHIVSAMNSFPDASIIDNLRVAEGAGVGYAAAVETSLKALELMESGQANLDDDTLALNGSAATTADYLNIYEMFEAGIPGVKIRNGVSPPIANPYRWSISNTNHGLVLRGHASNPTDALLAVAHTQQAFPGMQVSNQQIPAAGQPKDLEGTRRLLIGLLSRLEMGEGNLVGNSISLVGRASGKLVADEIDAKLKMEAPAGYLASTNILWPTSTAAEAEIPLADPYRWGLNKLPSGITVFGNVSGEPERRKILTSVMSSFEGFELTDQQVVARGAPENFDDVRIALTNQLKLLETGQVNIVQNQVVVTGRAKNSNIRRLIERRIRRNLPDDYTLRVDVTVPPSRAEKAKPVLFRSAEPAFESPEQCEAAIGKAVDGRKIEFEKASAAIRSVSEVVLDSVIEIARRCTDYLVEVVGYTDSRGSDSFNLKLSEARATAVVRFMTSKGISASHLAAIGKGEEDPVVSNDTEAGRAQNRRIEFKVKAK